MKQSEIKPCAFCDEPVMHCGNTFLRITASYLITSDNRWRGTLNSVLSLAPDADELSRATDLFVCNDCAIRRPILDLIENAVPTDERFREDEETSP